jgi:hypothetical protein
MARKPYLLAAGVKSILAEAGEQDSKTPAEAKSWRGISAIIAGPGCKSRAFVRRAFPDAFPTRARLVVVALKFVRVADRELRREWIRFSANSRARNSAFFFIQPETRPGRRQSPQQVHGSRAAGAAIALRSWCGLSSHAME